MLSLVVASALASVVRVPGGHVMDEACIHNHANGVVDVDAFRPCKPVSDNLKRVQTYAMNVNHGGDNSVMLQMNTSWNVPDLPEKHGGQVVYFWPGFKSKEPVMGLPVLQPVLQYGQHGEAWELQSWFVDGNAFVSHTGPLIKDVRPGDMIDSWMGFNGTTSLWTCSCTIRRTGETSVLQLTSEKVFNVHFHYAMLVLETIMPDESCALYPNATAGGPVTFSNVKVNNNNVKWENTVYTQHQCGQNVTLDSVGGAVFSWKN